MAPMIALSIAPKTRPITASGTVRWRIVYALMSTREFPRPISSIAAAATPTLGQAAISEQGRRPEQHAHSEVQREASPLRKHESNEAADEASDSHHRVEVADSRAAEVEQVESERDDEDEGRARDDGLCAVDADDESQVAVAENGAKSRARVAEKRSALICRFCGTRGRRRR